MTNFEKFYAADAALETQLQSVLAFNPFDGGYVHNEAAFLGAILAHTPCVGEDLDEAQCWLEQGRNLPRAAEILEVRAGDYVTGDDFFEVQRVLAERQARRLRAYAAQFGTD
jgi:hypothetical protein